MGIWQQMPVTSDQTGEICFLLGAGEQGREKSTDLKPLPHFIVPLQAGLGERGEVRSKPANTYLIAYHVSENVMFILETLLCKRELGILHTYTGRALGSEDYYQALSYDLGKLPA